MVALDWTEFRQFHTLMAAAVMNGQAVPLLGASYPEWSLFRSQNTIEDGLLRLLKSLLPAKVRIVLLADRGFGRTELARTCQHLGIPYVIRIKPDVWIDHPKCHGILLDLPVKKCVCRLLRDVSFRKQNSVRQTIVVRWKPGLPQRRDEPWFLMTDLTQPPRRLSEFMADA